MVYIFIRVSLIESVHHLLTHQAESLRAKGISNNGDIGRPKPMG
jgi:hypothetical protein